MKKKPIEDKFLLSHLESIPQDSREVFLLSNASVRGVALQGTHTINQMRSNHDLGILETLVLGHGYLAGGLLASTVKGNDRVQLTIECGGPIKGVYVESWAVGAVRGYLKEVPIPIDKPLESFNLSPFFGPGFLTVTKLLEGKKTPFSGQVMLQHGTIAKDLAQYFLISEQSPTVVSLSIQFDKEGRVLGSGALFLQKLPGSDDAIIEEIEMVATNMSSMGKYLAEGKTAKQFFEENFSQFEPHYLESLPYGFSCPCDRKRYAEYLQSLPQDEKEGILKEGPFPLVLQCLNCSTTYAFTKDELESLLESV